MRINYRYLILTLALVVTIQVSAYDFVVDIEGNGDFTMVQDAINAVPDFRKNRTSWSHQLSASEAEQYTPGNILGDWVSTPTLFNYPD